MIVFVRFCLLLFFVFLIRQTESQGVSISSRPSSPLRVLEGQSLTLEWTFSVVTTLLRVELTGSKLRLALVEASPVSSSVRGIFIGRGTASSTETNATITLSSLNRNDTDNYVFTVIDNDGSFAQAPLQILVQYPPSLIPSPDQVVLEGDPPITLNCTRDGEPAPNITWTKVLANGSDSDVLGTDEQFILPSNRTSDGTYRCKASNGIGSDVNHTINVTVNFKPERFVFTARSSNENFCKGGIINITCSAVGKPVVHTYQLFRNDTLVHTSNNSVLVWSQETPAGGETVYTCVADNTVATANTTKNVTVNEGSGIEQLENVTAVEGTNAALNCVVTGIPMPSVSWLEVKTGNHFSQNPFVFANVSRKQAGEYICHARNPCGNDSKSGILTVNYPPEGVQLQVSEDTVCKGANVIFNCSAADANPMELTYHLYENNVMVSNSSSSTGIWNRTMTIEGVFGYKCNVNNSVGTAMSSNVSVTVNEESVIKQLENVTAVEGTNAALNCVVTGIPMPSVSWLEVKTGNHFSQNPFVLANVSRKQAGEYICHARNPCGNDSKSGILTVNYPPEGVQLRVSEDTVCKGANVIFNCSAADANPMELTYHLYEDNVMVSNSSSSTGIWNRTMTIEGVFGYKCNVTNIVGTAMSSNISVTVSVPPSIQPLDNVIIIEGGNVKLTCNASGFPAPTVYWVKTGTGDRFNGTELVFANINRIEAGEYTCVASTPCNTSTELAEVDVLYPPSLTTRAPNQLVLEGDPEITLTCTADGEPEPNITWTKVFANGSDSEVLFTGKQFILPSNRTNDGTYRCKASNGIGSDVNHTVDVVVNFKPEKFNFTVEAVKNGSLCKRDTVNISCSAVGKPSVHTYQVFEDGNLVHTSNTGELFLSHATTTGGDVRYTCVANNTVAIANTTKNVTVNEGSVIEQVENVTVVEGKNAILNCAVTGFPGPSVSWLEVKTGTFFGNPLALTNVSRNQSGEYICEAYNTCGNDSASGILTVNYPPEGVQLQVSEDTVCKGANVIFNCSVTDANPTELTYHLYENNVTVITSSITGVWNITMTTGGVFGYKCKVNNTIRAAMSENVTITVNEPSSIVPFTKKEITEGSNLKVMCNASGIPQPTVFWVKTSNGGRTNGTDLVFTNINRPQSGDYTCKASNPCGDATQSVEIDVQFKPEMVQLMASKTAVCKGESIFLNCSASSKPAVHSYQLYENGTMVNEGYSGGGVWLRTMETGGVFVYKCKVNNTIGTAMSENVSITVNEPATIETVGKSAVGEGGHLTLSCQASGDPFPSVSWVKVMGGKRFNGSNWFLRNVNGNASGEYRCEAANLCYSVSRVIEVDVRYAPEITYISASQTLNRDKMLNLNCTAVGEPTPNITWTIVSNGETVNMPLTVTGNKYATVYRCTASNEIKTVFKDTLVTRGYCEGDCKGAKKCLDGLCRCGDGRTGETCETIEQPKKSFAAGLELTNVPFKEAYKNLENPETRALTERIKKAVKDELSGTGLTRVRVASLRAGSVIADLELTFNESTYEDYLRERLLDATKDNKLGDFQVEQVVVGTFISTDKPKPSECNQFFEGEDCKKAAGPLIALIVVAVIVVVAILIGIVACSLHKKNASGRGSFQNVKVSQRQDPEGNNSLARDYVEPGGSRDTLHGEDNTGYDPEKPPESTQMVTFNSNNGQMQGIHLPDSRSQET